MMIHCITYASLHTHTRIVSYGLLPSCVVCMSMRVCGCVGVWVCGCVVHVYECASVLECGRVMGVVGVQVCECASV